eukprot:540279_1
MYTIVHHHHHPNYHPIILYHRLVMIILLLFEDRNKRKLVVHDIESLYLCHFHSQIVDNYTHSDIHTLNNYFDDLENELNIINHPLPKYVRDYS